jgi:hypothetical protein
MKKRNLWPELLLLLLVLGAVWRLLSLSVIPGRARELYDRYPIFAWAPTSMEALKAKPSATPMPLPTLTPAPDQYYVQLPLADITQAEGLAGAALSNDPVRARLVLISKVTSTLPNGTVEASYRSNSFCVGLAAFLDADGQRMETYDREKTKSILFALALDDLALYGAALSARERLYIAPDPNCRR